MDSLQNAIEKARREREGLIGQTAAPGVRERFTKSTDEAVQPNDGPTGGHEDVERTVEAVDSPHERPARIRFSNLRNLPPGKAALSRNRVIAGDHYDPRVEVYRQLRSLVLSTMKRHNWRTLAITSAHENAGKTLTAVNLAIIMAQDASQSVMLVDLDLREPDVSATLATPVDKGVVDYLLYGEPLENILFTPGVPGLAVLPGAPQGRHASEILASPEMQAFLDEVATHHVDQIVIFDLPPLLRNDDAMVFAPKADACLLVVEDGVTRPEDIERSLQLLGQSNVIGTVLNKSR